MPRVPSALVFIGSGCRHCPIVLDGLARLVREGRLGRLEVINATVEPELAVRNKVRSVPWTRIGHFELIGALTPAELADWTELATTGEGWSAYFVHLIENRRLDELEQQIRDRPSTMVDLLALLKEEDVPMGTRIGISAVVEIPEGGAEGVLMTQGGRFAGVGLYLLDGRPVFHYNLCGVEGYTVAGDEPLSEGRHVVTLDFAYDGGGVGKGGQATLSVDGVTVGSERLPQTIAYRMSLDETLDIGEDTGTPVSDDYDVPFEFTGTLEKVTINITEQKLTEEQLRKYREGRLKAAMSQ